MKYVIYLMKALNIMSLLSVAAYIQIPSAHTIKESKMMTRTVNQAVIGHKISEQEFIRVKDRFGEPELKSKEMYYISNQEYKKFKLFEVKLMIKLNKRLCFIGYQ